MGVPVAGMVLVESSWVRQTGMSTLFEYSRRPEQGAGESERVHPSQGGGLVVGGPKPFLRFPSSTTFATDTPARLPGIGDFVKISEGG
jgi:hypothetical protein